MKAYKEYFIFAFDFVGVCKRKDFWVVFPLILIVNAISFVFLFLGPIFQIISVLLFLVFTIPTASIVVRRLHDTDRSAKYLFWLFLPVIGMIIVLTLLTEKTKYEIDNK